MVKETSFLAYVKCFTFSFSLSNKKKTEIDRKFLSWRLKLCKQLSKIIVAVVNVGQSGGSKKEMFVKFASIVNTMFNHLTENCAIISSIEEIKSC